MRQIYTLLAAALVIGSTSCSSSRNAQNADDIYYSNGSSKTVAATNSMSSGGAGQGDYYSTAPSDNYVRMAMTDPARWSQFDDYNSFDSYYYSPGLSAGYGFGYPAFGFGSPAYGMGLGFGYGMGFGYGAGLWDPYMAWNSYFMWNSWYNPYFYNPYYGAPMMIVGHSGPTAIYSNLRPFNSLAYRNGLYAKTGTGAAGNRYYRPGMSGTAAYNNHVSGSGRPVNGTYYRPVNNNSNNGFRPAGSFSSPTRSFSSPSFGGGGGGGGFRPGRH